MNRQEMFDKGAMHLMTQGEQSISDDGCCMYLDPEGRKCVIGALIPDHLYQEEMDKEGIGVIPLMQKFPEIRALLGGAENESFLEQLQEIHDEMRLEEWRERLAILAEDFGLSAEVLDRC